MFDWLKNFFKAIENSFVALWSGWFSHDNKKDNEKKDNEKKPIESKTDLIKESEKK